MDTNEKPAPANPELLALAESFDRPRESPAGDPAPGAAAARVTREQSALACGEAIVNALADFVQSEFPPLSYPPATRAQGAAVIAPLVLKYENTAWLMRWKEEFAAGVFFAGIAWQSAKLYRAGKAKAATPPAPADDAPA